MLYKIVCEASLLLLFQIQFLAREDPLEKEMATLSSIIA